MKFTLTKELNYQKFILFVVLLILLPVKSLSQSGRVSGIVKDMEKNESIIGANVIVTGANKIPLGSSTDITGKFQINNLVNGKYTITISCIGYKLYKKNFEIKNNLYDLGIIKLKQDTINLEEIITFAKAIPMVQKDDTLEYNAIAFKVQEGADASELIEKLPGIVVTNDKIQANGKDVSKVLVDGKPVYEKDSKATMQTVPANMVDKVQVYDKMSDDAAFRGFDDGNKSTVIDIRTKPKFKNSQQLKISAGYGNEERYAAGSNLVVMDDGNRYTIGADLGNIINSRSLEGRAMPNIIIMSGGPMFDESAGSNKNKSRTLRFSIDNKLSESIDLLGGLGLTYFRREDESSTYRDYFLLPPNTQTYFENQKSISSNTSYSGNFSATLKFDSSNFLKISPSFQYGDNENKSGSNGLMNTDKGFLNSSLYRSESNNENYIISGSVLYNHKFDKNGRMVNLMFDLSNSKTDNQRLSYSERLYASNSALSDSMTQRMPQNDKERKFTIETGFIEPLSPEIQLQVSANYSRIRKNNDLITYTSNDIPEHYFTDSAQSNAYERIYDQGFISARTNIKLSSVNISGGLKLKSTAFKNESSYPKTLSIEKQYTNFLPSVSFSYSANKTNSLRLMYDVMEMLPTADMLRPVPDYSNPLYIISGNPDLKPENMHFLMLMCMVTNPATASNFNLMVNGTYRQDALTNSLIYSAKDTTLSNGIHLLPGARYSEWKNINGAYYMSANAGYSFVWDLIKSNVNFNLSFSLNKYLGFLNDEENNTINKTVKFQFSLKTNINPNFSINLISDSRYNFNENTLSNSSTQDYFNESVKINLLWNIVYNIVFTSDLYYIYNGILQGGKNPNTYYLDLGISRKLFSQNQGEVRFAVYDVFDNDNSYNRYNGPYFYQETNRNSLGIYYVLAFKYNLNSF